eukprot:GHVN01085352.1.p1 GENE.GHVN01085352.1~~GHVN01085352.1.p1  ORF type:complete len:159 (-),score=22.30 GHVN01085352.1:1482-1958(-)
MPEFTMTFDETAYQRVKETADDAFQRKDYKAAPIHYSEAMAFSNIPSTNSVALFNNRSACYHNLDCAERSLRDAEEGLKMEVNCRGLQRKANAYRSLGLQNEALKAYRECNLMDPDNPIVAADLEDMRMKCELWESQFGDRYKRLGKVTDHKKNKDDP